MPKKVIEFSAFLCQLMTLTFSKIMLSSFPLVAPFLLTFFLLRPVLQIAEYVPPVQIVFIDKHIEKNDRNECRDDRDPCIHDPISTCHTVSEDKVESI